MSSEAKYRNLYIPSKKTVGSGKVMPYPSEKPSDYSERLSVLYSSKVSTDHKKDFGQFFTPLSIARFMGALPKQSKNKLRILDPGCGLGVLSISVIEDIISRGNVHTIELVAFETDINVLPLVEKCYKYLGEWLKTKQIEFTYFLCKNDFILHNSHVLQNQISVHESYDIIISNPPYFKLPKDDERAIAAKSVIYGQTNIYTIFLLIASKLINETGELIFITPRSFCSGAYYRLFRQLFFDTVNIKFIHVFNSRRDAFKKDGVLQENIIILATKKIQHQPEQIKLPFTQAVIEKIVVSSSQGIHDLTNRRIKEFALTSLVNFESNQKILHLPSSEVDEQVIDIFKTWTGSLKSYNLEISTGPVVDFRSEGMINSKWNKDHVPLLWLTNVEPMKVTWPRKDHSRGKPKGQYIVNNLSSRSRLVPNKNYVLLRRFSAKDDRRRLIAAPYFNSQYNYELVGIENHLNYIYHKSGIMSDIETVGLSSLLNSLLFDIYFRTFNGNINVSATELRDFPLPDFDLIRTLGDRINKRKLNISMTELDELVAETFNLKIDLSKIYGQ
jgi:adenine-specific DNA-methyltransferase